MWVNVEFQMNWEANSPRARERGVATGSAGGVRGSRRRPGWRRARLQLGARAGDYFEVLSGLKPGEVGCDSGNFPRRGRGKLKSATQKW